MSIKKQLITFFIVGVINTMVGYAWYALFIFCGLTYPIALLMSTCLGVLFNFKTMGKFVFKNSNNMLIFKFIGVYTFLYFFNMKLIGLLNPLIPNLYLAGLIAIIPSAALGFLLNKFLVFRKAYACVEEEETTH
ncbi:MAG: GtrA family protein [Tatlockia sp.]|jgi:putative flippase GtrA